MGFVWSIKCFISWVSSDVQWYFWNCAAALVVVVSIASILFGQNLWFWGRRIVVPPCVIGFGVSFLPELLVYMCILFILLINQGLVIVEWALWLVYTFWLFWSGYCCCQVSDLGLFDSGGGKWWRWWSNQRLIGHVIFLIFFLFFFMSTSDNR